MDQASGSRLYMKTSLSTWRARLRNVSVHRDVMPRFSLTIDKYPAQVDQAHGHGKYRHDVRNIGGNVSTSEDFWAIGVDEAAHEVHRKCHNDSARRHDQDPDDESSSSS